MSDDENVIHFAPRATPDTDDDKTSHICNHLNLRRELRGNALTNGLVGFDEFSQTIMLLRPIPRPGLKQPKTYTLRPWADSDDAALCEHLNRRGFRRVGRGLVREVIELEAQSHRFHPLRDYLDSLTWDGTPRLSRFLIEFCGAVPGGEDDGERADSLRYVEAVTRCFFIAAVARIYEPGCKADCMLILEGPQGAMKSRLLRVLATRDEWFSDSLPHDLAAKDARQHLAGKWLIEMSEIAQFRRSEIETVKSYLSCQSDKYRPPYGRSDITVPRQCVFVGSTNATAYLHDPTGNRRFWPVKVGTIKLVKAETIVGQLWAEAVVAWRKGEQWWLTDRVERLAVEEQKGRLELDPWFDLITEYVETRVNGAWFTTAEILERLGVDKSRRERAHEMRVGNVLRELGCERRRERRGAGGRRQYVYRRSEENLDIEEDSM